MKLYEQISAEIAACRADCERHKADADDSVCYGAKLEVMQMLFEELKAGKAPELMREELQARLPELMAEKAQEAEHPTFDWYGEHYHYIVLDGTCDAYQTMLRLLA